MRIQYLFAISLRKYILYHVFCVDKKSSLTYFHNITSYFALGAVTTRSFAVPSYAFSWRCDDREFCYSKAGDEPIDKEHGSSVTKVMCQDVRKHCPIVTCKGATVPKKECCKVCPEGKTV